MRALRIVLSRIGLWLAVPLAVAACHGARGSAVPPGPDGPDGPPPPAAATLRGPEAFAGIADPAARSQALFAEVGRVLMHPRCMNCHPADRSPRQGDAALLHDPPVSGGADGRGVPAMQCRSCHQERNLELARVPGAPAWHLAPVEMAWQGRTLAGICAQLKDRARNGGRSLDAIVDHVAHDALVGWGWAPGHGRTPAPGNQARAGALLAAWVESGAVCPPEEMPR